MHIVELSDFFRPVIGGLERHVETLSRELVRLGHSVTVVTLQTGDSPPEETIAGGVRVIRIRSWSASLTALYADSARPFHPTVPDPGAMAALRQIVRRERPDVVHSHGWLQYSYFPLHHRRRGPAHVVTLHDYGLVCAKKTLRLAPRMAARSDGSAESADQSVDRSCSGPRMTKCLACAPDQYGAVKGTAVATGLRASRILHGRADRYIAISTAVAEGSRAALPHPSEIVVIPTLVPNDLPALALSTDRPSFLPRDDGYLMFVGALGEHKGLHVLLEAKRRMRNHPTLVVIGTQGADAPRIDDPNVVVAHDVPSEQVLASWMRASAAVVPSVWAEPMGQVAIEAMLVGLPVIASDIGGLRDVVEHGVTGLTVPAGDAGALAAALDRILDDPDAGRLMGEAGRVHARAFEAATVAPTIVKVFEEALRHRSGQYSESPATA